MMPKPVIKAICIVLAILTALSACAVIISVFAADMTAFTVTPVTGDNDADYLIPAGIILAAVMIIGVCVALPKIRQK